MLNTEKAYPTVAVKDMEVARKFYEGPLGLQEVSNERPDFVAYRTKDSMLFVYKQISPEPMGPPPSPGSWPTSKRRWRT